MYGNSICRFGATSFLCLFLLFPCTHLLPPPPSPHLFFSPLFFISNYRHMLHQFKIYIYPSQHTHSSFDFRSPHLLLLPPPQTVDHLFFHTLSHTHFVTDSANEAHLLFMPLSITAMARASNVSVTRNLMTYVQQLREQYPYWQRSLGADHVLVSCEGVRRDFSRNVLELQKNAIWLACDSMLAVGGFYPHKDLAMPSSTTASAAISSIDRPHLMFFLNSPHPIQGYDTWAEEETAFADESQDLDMLSSSRYCVLFGHLEANVNLFVGMRLGCVPVIISKGYLFLLPFQDILDWQQFSLVVSFANLSSLKSILTQVPQDKYQELKQSAIAASNHFHWNFPPRPYDAFHLLMYELWLRRHTVRYVRRSSR